MIRYQLFGQNFFCFTNLLAAFANYQWEAFVLPVIEQVNVLLPEIKRRYNNLQRLFLHADPVRSNDQEDPLFYAQSKRKVAQAAARRYALGVQPRGVHMSIHDASSKREHINIALKCRHPSLLVSELLEPTWRYVFDQMECSF